jgi:hypothetical protein
MHRLEQLHAARGESIEAYLAERWREHLQQYVCEKWPA